MALQGGEQVTKHNALDLLSQETRQAFDLGKAPLFGIAVAKGAPNKHVLTITMHHVRSRHFVSFFHTAIQCSLSLTRVAMQTVMDGWSLGRVLPDILGLYSEAVLGRTTLSSLPFQFADYAAWCDP